MLFSFLLPTRKRPDLLQRFFDSLYETTRLKEEIEVILAVDEDDPESVAITDARLSIKKVILPPGRPMGELNRSCFEASSGRYVMLVNDDVILRTRNWDQKVAAAFRNFKDDIGLVHTNDLLFRDKLCTFPLLSRKACLAIGICPAAYRRYRIDDHIYDTYGMLALLGHKRIIYLPEVIFEHDNYHTDYQGDDTEIFQGEAAKVYLPNQAILKKDSQTYEYSLDDRKAAALNLARMIESERTQRQQSHYPSLLSTITDSRTCRLPHNVTRIPPLSNDTHLSHPSLTIAVVTADVTQQHAAECIAKLKAHTQGIGFDLFILDNNDSDHFNHPHEMNKVLATVDSDYVVLMDDDVYVTSGWLEGLFQALNDEVGVVAPLHKNGQGALSFSGAYLMGDRLGTHAHLLDLPDQPRVVPCACSACLLIDMKKCGEVLFNPAYQKYFLDIDYSLKIWQTGYQLVVTPRAMVTHLSGATMPHGSTASIKLWNRDLRIFIRDWVESGQLKHIEDNIWPEYPFLHLLSYLPQRINDLLKEEPSWEFTAFQQELEELMGLCRPFDLFQSLLVTCLQQHTDFCSHQGDQLKADFCQKALERLKYVKIVPSGPMPVLDEAYQGYNIVAYRDRFYASPQSLGSMDLTQTATRRHPQIITTDSLAEARALIDRRMAGNPLPEKAPSPAKTAEDQPNLILEGYKGFNIIRHRDTFYGLLQGDGAFDWERIKAKDYYHYFRGKSVQDVKSAIDRAFWLKYLKKGRDFRQRLFNFLSLSENNRSVSPTAGPTSARAKPQPKLILENYHQFNIILFDTRYFGIRQAAGRFDIEAVRKQRYQPLFIGHTLAEVQREIDKAVAIESPVSGSPTQSEKLRALLFCGRSAFPDPIVPDHLHEYELTLLTPLEEPIPEAYASYRRIPYSRDDVTDGHQVSRTLHETIAAHQFDLTILVYDEGTFWTTNHLESLAASFSDRLLIMFANGRKRLYKGEDIRRIQYNKAYLNSMFQHVPSLADKSVIDVGCSDGLVCDLLLSEGPKHILGIDTLETVGCSYPHEKITYRTMDAMALDLADNSFDLCLSIATLEHVVNPEKALNEMFRIVKPGGFLYVQAGPLYFSPFGHHMFGYFDDYPWIHLRLSQEKIIDHARQRQLDEQIKETRGMGLEKYVVQMLHPDHLNRLPYEAYGLEPFMNRPGIEVLHFALSHEGGELLNETIMNEIGSRPKDQLTTHGFELIARKR